MSSSSLLSLALCLLFLFHTSLAQRQHGEQRPNSKQSECGSEAGLEELWKENNEQLESAGVATIRYRIQPQDRNLTIIVEGVGYIENVIPVSCLETFESSHQSDGERGQRHRDQRQRIQWLEHRNIEVVQPANQDSMAVDQDVTEDVADDLAGIIIDLGVNENIALSDDILGADVQFSVANTNVVRVCYV